MAKPKEEKTDEVKKYEPTMESQYKFTEEDKAMQKKIEAKYGSKLDELYPFVVRNFVTGYKHCKEREKETYMRLDHYLERYEQYKFNTILDEPLANEEEMFQAWKLYTYGYDKQGHPVLYDEIASADIAAVNKAFKDDMELLRTYRFRFHRRLANTKRIQAEKLDTILYKHTFIMDLSGFSSSHFGSNYRNTVKEIIGDEQNVFPETLYVMFLINTPWAFRMIWRIVGTFIDPITYEKIKVLGSDYIGEMTKYIDIDQIPAKYKGKGKKPIKYGFCSDLEDGGVSYPGNKKAKEEDDEKDPKDQANGNDDKPPSYDTTVDK
mmetsp:Transcript_43114/g.38351  ORF Transcript_43114/g.38351 Transcript_43114/m.38351 type:complete len:321 (-) Transcript_43114:47-1009(-)